MDTQTNQQLVLKSELQSITKVESFVDELRHTYGISEEIYGNILVVMTEAVTNAIIHGNKSDANKTVTVGFEKNNNMISFHVEDQGKGFDYANLPDPTSSENIEKPSGRGVFLMMHLADLVVFSKSGSKVEIQFKL